MMSQEITEGGFSARQALIDLKAKLALCSLGKADTVTLSPLECRMILALVDEKTPWSK